jgi:uracil DNA glycosylase
MTNLKWEAFAPLFGQSYRDRIRPKFEEGILDPIYSVLKDTSRKKDVQGNWRKCAPDSNKVFYATIATPLSDLKVVMVGMAPYHTERDNKKVADGLMMSASNHDDYMPPSLEKFYEGLEGEFSGRNNGWRSNDLHYLAYQGVLMWNIGLTCEIRKSMSHNLLWYPFQEWFFQEVIGPTMVPVIILGDESEVCKKWLYPTQRHFKLNHPVNASYKGGVWDTKNTFSQVNRILKDNNGYEINWLPTKQECEDLSLPF